MNLTLAEKHRRWHALGTHLRRAGIDVLVCAGGDDAGSIADVRYLAGHARANTGLLFFADERVELVTATALQYLWLSRLSWASLVHLDGDVVSFVTDRLKQYGRQLTIGVSSASTLSDRWRLALGSISSEVLDVSAELKRMRAVKSEEEIALISNSARIADEAFLELMPIVRAGMNQNLLRAELDYAVIAAGAEETSGSCICYPRRDQRYAPAASWLSREALQDGDFAMIEVTPRYCGYLSQLATMICVGQPAEGYRRMYEVSVAARESGLELLKPGADLAEVVERMAAHVKSSGFDFIGEACGHVLGLTVSEPRITKGISYELRPGMAVVLHAVVANTDKEEVIRADTFLVTQDGHRRLNGFGLDLSMT
jgi:Xaa-Pro aminopeptidase